MLGSITRSLNEVFTRLNSLPFTAEAKLDGQRVQIHARINGPQGEDDGGGRWVQSDDAKVWVRLFSRYVNFSSSTVSHMVMLTLSYQSPRGHDGKVPRCLPISDDTTSPSSLIPTRFPKDRLPGAAINTRPASRRVDHFIYDGCRDCRC